MGNLLSGIGTYFMSVFASRVLIGAGLTVASYVTITSLVRGMLDDVIASIQGGDSMALAFIGMSGLDVGLSMIMSALLVRATISSSLFITKS